MPPVKESHVASPRDTAVGTENLTYQEIMDEDLLRTPKRIKDRPLAVSDEQLHQDTEATIFLPLLRIGILDSVSVFCGVCFTSAAVFPKRRKDRCRLLDNGAPECRWGCLLAS